MIDERQVREMLQRRAGAISSTSRDPSTTIRRARRWATVSELVGAVAIVSVVVAGAVAAPRLLERSAPVDEPAPSPTLTSPNPGVDPSPVYFPPKGVEPSSPTTSELLVYFGGEDVVDGVITITDINVYADGRVVWSRCSLLESYVDYTDTYQGCATSDQAGGSRYVNTGWVQQQLTPEAVRSLREELLATRELERSPDPVNSDDSDLLDWVTIRVNVGGRALEARANPVFLTPPPTDEQLDRLDHMQDILLNLEAWFEPSAWIDEKVTPFIPSSYGFWTKRGRESTLLRGSGRVAPLVPSDLPAPADHLLTRPGCDRVTLDEARAIIDGFEAAGISRSEEMSGAGIAFLVSGGEDARAVYFEPILPHEPMTPC